MSLESLDMFPKSVNSPRNMIKSKEEGRRLQISHNKNELSETTEVYQRMLSAH